MTAIFYFSRRANNRRGLHSIWKDGHFVGYVRVEIHDGDVDEAFAAARLQRGEVLMNTHEVAEPRSKKKGPIHGSR